MIGLAGLILAALASDLALLLAELEDSITELVIRAIAVLGAFAEANLLAIPIHADVGFLAGIGQLQTCSNRPIREIQQVFQEI